MNHWTFSNAEGAVVNIKINNALCSDDGRTLAELACLGAGIVFVDSLLIQPEIKAGLLIPILKEWQHPDIMPIHLIRLGQRARNKAVDVVWQYLGEQLKKAMVNH